jgi:hypothetical protein
MPLSRSGRSRRRSTRRNNQTSIKTDAHYLSCGGFRPAIEKLIQLLRSFRRFEDADFLEKQLRASAEPSGLTPAELAEWRVNTRLASQAQGAEPHREHVS